MNNPTDSTLALTAEEAQFVLPWAQWFAGTLRCCSPCALRFAGASRPALYAASDAALASALGLPLPEPGGSSGAAPEAAAPAAVCPTCLGALTCLPTQTNSNRSESSDNHACSLRDTLLTSRLAAGHDDASGFRLHVQLPPSLCGVRDHAAWFLAQAALAHVTAAAADAAPTADATAPVATDPPLPDHGDAPQTNNQATGTTPQVVAASPSSAWPSAWPKPSPPPPAPLSSAGDYRGTLPPRASSQVVPLKDALKWRLGTRLPSVLNLPMLPQPAQARPSISSSINGAAAYSAAAGAASASGDTLAAATIAYGDISVAELNALDLCVEPAVGSGLHAIQSAKADGLLAELLQLDSASEQYGSRGGGFGNGGKKRARSGWNGSNSSNSGGGKGGKGGKGGGGKWAKGDDTGKGFGGKGNQGEGNGGEERNGEQGSDRTSTADVVAASAEEASASATATEEPAANAAVAAAVAATTAAAAAASLPNGESMNKRCECLSEAEQRGLAAWLADQMIPAPPLPSQFSVVAEAHGHSGPEVNTSTTASTATNTTANGGPSSSDDGNIRNVEAAASALEWTCSWQRPPIFLGGRYRKLARDVPQSPWIIDGVRKGRGSVDECLTHAVAAAFGVPLVPISTTHSAASTSTTTSTSSPAAVVAAESSMAATAVPQSLEEEDFDESRSPNASGLPNGSTTAANTAVECVKFHGAGREDIDVRMLGRGRPFILEVINPRTLKPLLQAAAAAETGAPSPSPSSTVPRLLPLPAVEAAVNAADGFNAQGDVEVEALHFVPRSVYEDVLAGAEEKTKTYRVVCWVSHPLTEAFVVQRLSATKDLALAQQTPLRVLHRRTNMTRGKMIHAIRVTKFLGPHWFCVDLDASAGTYIKEFVHGDLGRTRPSVADLLQPDMMHSMAPAAVGGSDASSTTQGALLPRLRADILQLDVSAVHMAGVLA